MKVAKPIYEKASYSSKNIVGEWAFTFTYSTPKPYITVVTIQAGVNDLLMQCTPLFMEQTGSLTTYQMNMLRAIIDGQHTQWTSQEVLSKYGLGTKSNVAKMQKVLLERDFIVATEQGLFLSDPVMGLWMQRRKN